MKQLYLNHNKIALVDDDIYELIGYLKWTANKLGNNWYAVRNFEDFEGHMKGQFLHHFVVGQPLDGFEVDHIDGDGLNNQRLNLRTVTTSQNQQNTYRHRNGRLVGCYLLKGRNLTKPWKAQIRIAKNKQKHIGYFATELEAHEAYLAASEKL
jgi:hypothetical protein